jgi:uncharacterized protein YpuA (DUF1002 family)
MQKKHLITASNKDPAVAYDIIQNLTHRMKVDPNFAEWQKAAPFVKGMEEVEVDTRIVDRLRHYVDWHKTGGTIPLEQ